MVLTGQWVVYDPTECTCWRFCESTVPHAYRRYNTGVGSSTGAASGGDEAISLEEDQCSIPDCAALEGLQALGLQARGANSQVGDLRWRMDRCGDLGSAKQRDWNIQTATSEEIPD